MAQTDTTACLYIVATPIGNLADISQRAIDTLKQVDLILAEDTRHSKKLLNYLGISNHISSFHAHNESHKSHEFIKLIQNGQNIALISDAGTPLISDPGYPLVQAARNAGIKVTPIPGACAITAALSACGLACDKFYFEGFLPAKSCARRTRIKQLATSPVTTVYYESTHRIIDSLSDMAAVLGNDRQLVLAKELTKQFESFVQGSANEIITWLTEDTKRQQGEFVVIIEAYRAPEQDTGHIEQVLKILLKDLPMKQAVKLTCEITGGKKNAIYQLALDLSSS